MFETAYAKINLALHVRSREADGYHRIETIFAFAEDGDRLSIGGGDDLSLDVTGPFAGELGGGSDNLVLRAAEALRQASGTTEGAALALDKRLPVAAGLGGGSADAAAALRLLTRWWRLPCSLDDLEGIGRSLGADVAACVRSVLVRGDGRGDRLGQLVSGPLSGTPLLIVNPRVPLSTPAVFAGWDGKDRGPLQTDATLADARAGRNDLEEPATELAPAVGDVLAALAEEGEALLVRMSGSGASCFALFADSEARDRSAARIARSRPDWWLLATRIRGEGNADS